MNNTALKQLAQQCLLDRTHQTKSADEADGSIRADRADRAYAARGVAAIRVSVSRTKGSVPRLAGSAMLVTLHSSHGSIGGGHLEFEAIALARSMLNDQARPSSQARSTAPDNTTTPANTTPGVTTPGVTTSGNTNGTQRTTYALGPSLGQCCGGSVELLFEVITQDLVDHWPAHAHRFTLGLFGAGHVGQAIVNALTPIACAITWIDERQEQFEKAQIVSPNVTRICSDEPIDEVAHLSAGAFIIICTHSHVLDLELCASALKRSDLGFVGLIGSATKRARFLNRLQAKGFSPECLLRLQCPIGLSGILGKEPEIIAASVAAQLLLIASHPISVANIVTAQALEVDSV